MPPGAFLARYGGEEFAVLLRDHDMHEAHAVIVDLCARTPGGQSFSAGVAERGQGDLGGPVALIAAADKALYRAKRSGRNQVVTATDSDLDGSAHPGGDPGVALAPIAPTMRSRRDQRRHP